MGPRRIVSLVLLLAVSAPACGGGGGQPQPPAAPGADDPAYSVSGLRNWYLVGNALTPGNDEVNLRVTGPAGTAGVDAWIDGDGPYSLTADGADFAGPIDIADLPAGDHELLLALPDAEVAFASRQLRRSHPIYVFVSNDWDESNNRPLSLQLQEELHTAYPKMKMTHFVGPYTFTDPAVSEQRRGELVDWVKMMRDTYGDEIGLHIHPYCNFIDTTSVPCHTMPSTVYDAGDTTGYTVEVSSYTTEDFTTILQAADDLFTTYGLDKPTAFRAGGWTADESTLQALANDGFVVNASANNWARMEEWMGQQNGVLYTWNMEHWATINDTSQPYYPASDDILQPGEPASGVLEVPDNGILVDYVSSDEMVQIFEANWPGGPLTEPKVFSIGYHPPNFNINYETTLSTVLTRVEENLAENDEGPVVYATASDLTKVWTR